LDDKIAPSIFAKILKLNEEMKIEGNDEEQVEKILPLAEEILEVIPLQFDALYAKAISLLILKDYEGFLIQCEKILEPYPQAYQIYDLKALILKLQGKVKESNEVLQKLMQLKERPLISMEGFILEKCKIILKITDPKTMMLHHQWIWHLQNISANSLGALQFIYEGDTTRNIEHLHFTATDNFQNYLNAEIQINYPQRKIINVFLNESINSGQRGGPYFLDFDRESPKRTEYHQINSGTTEFSYELQIPKNYDWTPKIFEVNEYFEETPVESSIKKQTLGNYNLFFWKTLEPKENIQYKIEW